MNDLAIKIRSPKVGVIVQARMGSSRLPGKVLKEVLGRPLLFYEIERLRRVQNASQIVIATTTDSKDEPIVEFAQKNRIEVFQGSEQDVLSRYYECAKKFQFEIIVRVTADCPLIDPAVIDRVLETMIECKDYEYVSNTLTRSYPRGLDVEAFYFRILEKVHHDARAVEDREHVTLAMHRMIRQDLLRNISHTENLSRHRWTVDTIEDFELVRRIIEALYPSHPNFDFLDVCALLRQHPDWCDLNAHITQK